MGVNMYERTMDYFKELSKIPRPSGKEAQVREWLKAWADKRWFTYEVDDKGNLLVRVSATPGMENVPKLMIQSHMDMVPNQIQWGTHNFDTDPIETFEQDGWLYAKDKATTLGADNGIGLAMGMAAADAEQHGAIDLLFTVEEEIWLKGASALKVKTDAELLLNLDTEEEWLVCNESAGNGRMRVKKSYDTKEATYPQYTFSIAGGKEGHSGVEIHNKSINANEILMKILRGYNGDYELASIKWWAAMNSIPGDATAVIGFKDDDAAMEFNMYASGYLSKQKKIYDDPNMILTLDKNKWVESIPVMYDPTDEDNNAGRDFCQLATKFDTGVIKWHPEAKTLVQTSNNMGEISLENGQIAIWYMPRSSVDSELATVIEEITAHYREHWFSYGSISDGIFTENEIGVWRKWLQDPSHPFVKFVVAQYSKALGEGKMAQIGPMHAWLELEAVMAALPSIKAWISIGPNIIKAHKAWEGVELSSVRKVAEAVDAIVRNLTQAEVA
jgi:dipeptidase D